MYIKGTMLSVNDINSCCCKWMKYQILIIQCVCARSVICCRLIVCRQPFVRSIILVDLTITIMICNGNTCAASLQAGTSIYPLSLLPPLSIHIYVAGSCRNNQHIRTVHGIYCFICNVFLGPEKQKHMLKHSTTHYKHNYTYQLIHPTSIHSFITIFIHSSCYSFIHLSHYSIITLFSYSSHFSVIHQTIHSFIHSLIYSLTHSFTHSFSQSFSIRNI